MEPGLRPRSMVVCATLWLWPFRMATGGLSTPLTSMQLVGAEDDTHTFTHSNASHCQVFLCLFATDMCRLCSDVHLWGTSCVVLWGAGIAEATPCSKGRLQVGY